MTKHNFLRCLEKKQEKLPFFSATHKIAYIAGYLLSTQTTNIESAMTIFGRCHDVLNNKYISSDLMFCEMFGGFFPIKFSHS